VDNIECERKRGNEGVEPRVVGNERVTKAERVNDQSKVRERGRGQKRDCDTEREKDQKRFREERGACDRQSIRFRALGVVVSSSCKLGKLPE